MNGLSKLVSKIEQKRAIIKKSLFLLSILLLFAVIILTVKQVQQQQELRSKASEEQYTFKPQLQPAKSDYLLGAYYMPKPHTKTHQWYLVEKWNKVMRRRDREDLLREPLLGLYNGDNSRVMDWHIKWAVEHGLSFFIFDEFWTVSPDPSPQPDYTSINAFLSSSYQDRMKFAVMLTRAATENSSEEEVEEFLTEKVIPYWVNHYFNQENYLRVNGSPLVVIYSPREFHQWRPDKVKYLLDKASNKAESLTGQPIFWVSQREWTGQNRMINFSWYKAAGFKAIAPYKLAGFEPTYEDEVQVRKENKITYQKFVERVVETNRRYLKIAHEEGIKYITNIPADFDPRTRGRTADGKDRFHTVNQSLLLYTDMLQRTKQLIDRASQEAPRSLLKLDKDYRISLTGKPVVILSTFNEWNEDTSLEPGFQPLIHSILNPETTRRDPFAILKQVREVFTNKDNFPDYTLPPQLEGIGGAKTSWDFSSDELRVWYIRPGATALKLINANEAQSWISTRLHMWARTNIMAQNSHSVSIQMKVACPISAPSCLGKSSFFWNTNDKPGGYINSARQRMDFIVNPDGEWHEYTIPVGESKDWARKVEAIGVLIQPRTPNVSVSFRKITIND